MEHLRNIVSHTFHQLGGLQGHNILPVISPFEGVVVGVNPFMCNRYTIHPRVNNNIFRVVKCVLLSK